MQKRLTTLERAFEIAQSGKVAGLSELRAQLKREGFSDYRMHTDGPAIQRQLNGLIAFARSSRFDEQR